MLQQVKMRLKLLVEVDLSTILESFVLISLHQLLDLSFFWCLCSVSVCLYPQKCQIVWVPCRMPTVAQWEHPARNAGDLGSSLGLGRSLQKGLATHSSTFVGRICCMHVAWGYSPWACRLRLDWATHTFTFHFAHSAYSVVHDGDCVVCECICVCVCVGNKMQEINRGGEGKERKWKKYDKERSA